MAYGSARFRSLECLTCNITFRCMVWRWDDPTDPRNTQIAADLHPLPHCSLPHLTFAYDINMTGCAQVRAAQRAVIYRFADGSWAQPGSNDPNDPVAQKSVHDGGIREEFYRYRDMIQFNNGMKRIKGGHEGAGYNDVIDFDHHSLTQRDTETIEIAQLRARERAGRKALDIIGGAGSQGRYEKLLRQRRERG
jgi:hypothetical protein